jgi:monofunctional biosynthetic peptidoglycan transglycosylase
VILRKVAKWVALACAGAVLLSMLAVLLLRWIDPVTSSFMMRAQATGEKVQYRWVDMAQISPHAQMAVIAAEDQLFPFHPGFDLDAIRDAAERNARSKRTRGASTISQQVAKNLFLWPERSFVRKGLEAWFTVLIEFMWPKERTLEVYLNIAQFGRGVYGVEAASKRYFRKTAAKLDRYEAATLAAVLPNPRRFRVDRPSPYLASRRDWIVAQMRGLGGPSYLKGLEDPEEAAARLKRRIEQSKRPGKL